MARATARNDYLSGITKEFKQKRIEQVLTTSLSSLKSFAPSFDSWNKEDDRASRGNGKKIRAQKEYYDEILDI